VETFRRRSRLDAPRPAALRRDAKVIGAACAFLCSVHAGHIVGQNWLLDGGANPGTF